MQTRRLHRLGQGANENGRVDARDDRLWVVDVGGGHLRVIQGHEALNELIKTYALASDVRIYELSAVAKTLGEIPEVASALVAASLPGPAPAPAIAEVEIVQVAKLAEPAVSVPAPAAPAPAPAPEPFIAPVPAPAPAVAKAEVEVAPPPAPPAVEPVQPAKVAPAAPPHNGSSHDSDFSLLDRPFEDDDYFEEPPRRWPRIAGAAAFVALLVGGSYKLLHAPHHASTVVAPLAPEPAAVAAPAAAAAPVPAAAPAPA
ncbi:MAG TPA: hypothetical protein VHL80_20980, partial [Polyangia bacterium]|nr:hypothetical protein [Polyangia bacterium]